MQISHTGVRGWSDSPRADAPLAAARSALMTVALSAWLTAGAAAQSASAVPIGAAGAAPVALSLEAALRLAQQRSLALVANDAAAVASREKAVAAGQLPDPVLKAGLTNLPVTGADRFSVTRDFMTMRSIGVMQEFTRSDKLSARSARFDARPKRHRPRARWRWPTCSATPRVAWLDRHYQERMLDMLRAQRAEAALQVEAADAAYRGGRGAQADVFAARSAGALIDDRIQRTEQQVATARTRLARWVGADADAPLGPPPDLAAAPLEPASLDAGLAHHPQIALLRRQEERGTGRGRRRAQRQARRTGASS